MIQAEQPLDRAAERLGRRGAGRVETRLLQITSHALPDEKAMQARVNW